MKIIGEFWDKQMRGGLMWNNHEKKLIQDLRELIEIKGNYLGVGK